MSMDMIIRTLCTFPSCDDGPGEPCTRHETEQAHAEGEHAFCGDDCEAGDFGHRPDDWDAQPVCARCRTHHVDEDGERYSIPAFWPCTTAVVLGLAVREVA